MSPTQIAVVLVVVVLVVLWFKMKKKKREMPAGGMTESSVPTQPRQDQEQGPMQ